MFLARLEETGIYTRDLKIASEPKPIWVWSQGLFDWDERPEQSVPTPEELGVQLVQNIGNGTKGILWFTFREGPGQQFPATKKAIQEWGRVIRLLREICWNRTHVAFGYQRTTNSGLLCTRKHEQVDRMSDQ